MKSSLYRGVLGLTLLFLVGSIPAASTEELPVLSPLKVHDRAMRFVVDQVRSNHLIRTVPLNDEASSQIYDEFIERLDRRKNFLLASDLREFESYRYELDDDLKRGRLDNAFKIINRLQKREDERYTWIIERLQRGVLSFDLGSNGAIPIESDDIEWAENREEADQRWEENLIDSIINLKQSKREMEDIQEVLVKRYTNRRNRNRQFTSEEAFALFLNAFTHIYDPHTVYFSPRVAEDFHMNMRMSLEGIGALLGTEDEHVKVLEIIKGGPADRDGRLKAGFVILGVGQGKDGAIIDVVGRRLDDVVDLIRGPSKTTLRLEVNSSLAEGGPNEVIEIVRGKIKLEDATAKKKSFTLNHGNADFNIGVIELPKMYADLDGERSNPGDYVSATQDVRKLINELKSEGLDALIIDLRNNGGGSLPEAHRLVGLFIDKGPTVQVKGLGRNRQVIHDTEEGTVWDGPLAVLVNRASASASEIFAGAIQDYGRGIVVGTQTYGKGSVQTILNLSHGQLKITQAKYYRITGHSTQNAGVTPDIEFPSLVDMEIVGENSYENSLELETIEAAEFESINLSQEIDQLTLWHEERVANDPFFDYYEAVSQRIEENRAIESVSLNENKRDTRRKQNSAWRLHTENQYLMAFGEEPVATIDELNDALSEISDRLDDEVDGMALETGRILLDLAQLTPALALVEDRSIQP